MRVLLVEDHAELQALVRSQLQHWGFAADIASDGRVALHKIQLTPYDAVILDLGLPDMDGLKVLQGLGRQVHRPACLILTARDALPSRVQALNAGADDYLTKPFDMDELQARLRAILRRAKGHTAGELRLGRMRFSPLNLQLHIDDQPMELSRKEAMLLEALLRASPGLVVRNRLEESLYAAHESASPNAIDALVSRLRKRLASTPGIAHIDTVRGVGYRITAGQVCSSITIGEERS
ncbi:response regulator transcription factor [Lampropedia puyangensis]|uniref:Response regulator transcription factor n=1 Tax=Lampropedia puyangensis TaxID=1330072 RepID=A0A4S8FCN5_9BURK|nr:response regulator transcription factor [Lampropedia puyangensis]THU05117.1 response regulator transcription factor [Lampropedia puyangensis]